MGVLMMPDHIRVELMTPSFRITSNIAMVRIRRLVQNGMVIRNSQRGRDLGGRVAMNHAVGKPISRVRIVVSKDSLTERQKIDRWASAQTKTPGSKMSSE